jgi:hypothetical protein
MARRHNLRVYYGPVEETLTLSETSASKTNVTLPLDEVAPLLADAVEHERTWLDDFKDDEITISSDLYEVLLAYQHFRRPSA